ncbi:MAG: hypothetical protein N2314_03660 [Brevinematales bacterium]|nr:hypothetical protein [Brevinematales bacterium]
MISIGQISFPLGETAIESRIVQVEVIEQRGDTVRLRINQVETTAKATGPVPEEFLALAEVHTQDKKTLVKLTPLEWLQGEKLSLHQERSLLSMVSERLFFLGMAPIADYLPWGYALAKVGLPLSKELLEAVFRLSRKYDKHTIPWILVAWREGFPPSEEVADFLRHITSWVMASLPEENTPLPQQRLEKFSQEEKLFPPWLGQLFATFSWTQNLIGLWRDSDTLAMAKWDDKKHVFHLLIEDEITGRWDIRIEVSKEQLTVIIMMDPELWKIRQDHMKPWAIECERRWSRNLDRRVSVHLRPWEDPWQFFLPDNPESQVRGINLYA